MKNYIRFTKNELITLFMMRAKGKTFREIKQANLKNRSISSMSEATAKYQHPCKMTWNSMSAISKAKHVLEQMQSNRARTGNKKIFLRNKEFCSDFINYLITQQTTVYDTCVKMNEKNGSKVVPSTFYRYIKEELPDLKKYLPRKGKPKRTRVKHRRSIISKAVPPKTNISQRTEATNNRTEFGHWEGDTVHSCKYGSNYAIVSIIERQTRFRKYFIVANLEAIHTNGVLRAYFMSLPPEARRSITFDNGSEFSTVQTSKYSFWLDDEFNVYYCDPYKSQQKGSVEHSNGLLRRFYPKGTDFINVNSFELKVVNQKINNRAMVVLNSNSAIQAFGEQLLKLKTADMQLCA